MKHVTAIKVASAAFLDSYALSVAQQPSIQYFQYISAVIHHDFVILGRRRENLFKQALP
jgi:hypothetical protein